MKELIKDIYCCCVGIVEKTEYTEKDNDCIALTFGCSKKNMKIKINFANNGLAEITHNVLLIV